MAVTFNIGGVDLMLQAANMSEMAWFFHRERLPSANAWTMALVATEACPGFQAEQVSMCLGNKIAYATHRTTYSKFMRQPLQPGHNGKCQ